MNQVVKLHCIPATTVSFHDLLFISSFWKSLYEAMEIELTFRYSYHPQLDSQTKRVKQIMKDLLSACVLVVGGSQESPLPLV